MPRPHIINISGFEIYPGMRLLILSHPATIPYHPPTLSIQLTMKMSTVLSSLASSFSTRLPADQPRRRSFDDSPAEMEPRATTRPSRRTCCQMMKSRSSSLSRNDR